MPSLGQILFALVGITTSVGGYIADWNKTHVYNPRWTPHAKFHNGQTMSMGLLLGLSTLYYTFRTSPSPAIQRENLQTAALLGSLYWITQLSAALYPGSLPVDPEFGDGFPQAYICAVELSLVTIGTIFERKRMLVEEKRE